MSDTQIQKDIDEGLAEITKVDEAPDLIGIAADLWLLSNHAAPHSIREFNQRLESLFGRNRYDEPNWRVVWGQTELTSFDGERRMKYPAVFVKEEQLLGHDIHNPNGKVTFVKGNNIPKKLKPGAFIVPRKRKVEIEVGMPFYVLERWLAPEEYFVPEEAWKYKTIHEAWDKENRYEWDAELGRNIDVMGPFPSRGVYEFVTYIKHQGHPRPPADDVIDLVRHILRTEEKLRSGYGYEQAISEIVDSINNEKAAKVEELRQSVEDAFDSPKALNIPMTGYEPARDATRRIIRPDEESNRPSTNKIIITGE